MSVPTVPNRSLQHLAAREHDRSHRSPPLKGGTKGTLPRTTRIESKVGLRMGCDLVPMRPSLGKGVYAVRAVLFSLPKIRGEK